MGAAPANACQPVLFLHTILYRRFVATFLRLLLHASTNARLLTVNVTACYFRHITTSYRSYKIRKYERKLHVPNLLIPYYIRYNSIQDRVDYAPLYVHSFVHMNVYTLNLTLMR